MVKCEVPGFYRHFTQLRTKRFVRWENLKGKSTSNEIALGWRRIDLLERGKPCMLDISLKKKEILTLTLGLGVRDRDSESCLGIWGVP